MLERLSPSARNLSLAVIAALVLWFSWTVRSVLNPLIFGYFLAYVVYPLVARLQRRGWSHTAAVNLIFSLALLSSAVILIALFLQGRELVRDLAAEDGVRARIADRVEETIERHGETIAGLLAFFQPGPTGDSVESDGASGQAAAALPEPGPGAEAAAAPEQAAQPEQAPQGLEGELGELFREFWSNLWTEERVVQASEAGLRVAGRSWGPLRHFFGSLVAFLTFLVLTPVYAYFLLFELDTIHSFVRRYLPRRERTRLVRIGTKIGAVLANFFRGRLLVCAVKGLILALGLWFAGVDYAFLIGFTSGFLSLVPFVGPLIGAVAAMLLALLDHGVLGSLLRIVIVFGLAELIEGYLLIPKVLGDSLGLHPVVVLVSVFAGGAALGMFGFLIALPLTATLIILVREFVLPALAEFADEQPST